jgi:hypothetical protein
MMTKFATICDIDDCNKRSQEYTAFPTCLVCTEDFCPDHGKVTIEADADQPEQGYCSNCIAAGYEGS